MNLKNYVLDLHTKTIALRGAILTEVNSIRSRLVKTTVSRTMTELRTDTTSSLLIPHAITITDSGREGVFYYDPTDTTTPDNGGMCLVTGTNFRYKRPLGSEGVNVKWFGAKGDGFTDDAPAIQAAIDWAKSQHTLNSGNMKVNVKFPNGSYHINASINATGANGIWLSGGIGKYETTTIDGNTGGIMIDFTGSTMSGCDHLTFFSGNLIPGNSAVNPSTIGVLFAFNGSGGLNCGMHDCFFLMGSQPTANNGLGKICLLNVKSEEFAAYGNVYRGDSPVIFTSSTTFHTRNVASYTAVSPFDTITSGGGSMGVIDMGKETSVSSESGQGHVFTLFGTNSLRFHGYIFGGGPIDGTRVEDAAIGFYQVNFNMVMTGTLESASTLAYIESGGQLHLSEVQFGYANMGIKNKPCFYIENGCDLFDTTLGVIFGNGTSDQPGDKYFLYSPPVLGGNAPSTTTIRNSKLIAPVWNFPAVFVSTNLLKNISGKTQLLSGGQSNWTDNETIHLGFPLPRTVGTTTGSGGTFIVDLAHFLLADKTTTTSGNGGSYTARIKGVITIGSYTSTNLCKAAFESTIIFLQKADGTRFPSESTTLIQAQASSSSGYATITEIRTDITTTGPYGVIRLAVLVSGTSSGDPIVYNGNLEMTTNFYVNATQLFD